MAKRVGVILSGCDRQRGSDPAETLLTLLILDRAGAEVVCAAPDAARADAARLVPGADGEAAVRPLAALDARDIDALVIPGGGGALTLLSDYAEKGQVCEVNPDVARLLRALLP
jgi:enhancing lycopene biosynthesis protein 2